MFGPRTSIAITLKKSQVEDGDKLFEALKSKLHDFDVNRRLDRIWEVSVLRTNTASSTRDSNNVSVEKKNIDEMSSSSSIFRTKTPITSMEELIDHMAIVSTWAEENFERNQQPSIEITSNVFKFPLFYKNKSYKPSRTWYDLKLLSDEEKNKVTAINTAVQERKR